MMIRLITVFLFLICCFSTPSQAKDQNIDFEDCDVLSGKTHQAEYRRIVTHQNRLAASGNVDAQALMADIANNRFACMAESIGDDGTGWAVTTVIKSSSDRNGDNRRISTNKKILDNDLLRKNPQVITALHEAFNRTQILADMDPDIRNMAAGYVADYPAFFRPTDYRKAYLYAAGTRALACNRPDILGQNHSSFFCSNAKAITATLYPRLNDRQRDEAET